MPRANAARALATTIDRIFASLIRRTITDLTPTLTARFCLFRSSHSFYSPQPPPGRPTATQPK
jgi:hypothetical protein